MFISLFGSVYMHDSLLVSLMENFMRTPGQFELLYAIRSYKTSQFKSYGPSPGCGLW